MATPRTPLPTHRIHLLLLAALAACSGSRTGPLAAGGDLLLVASTPTNDGEVYLNDPIDFDFTQSVDLDSASLTTVVIQELESATGDAGRVVQGRFVLATRPGDQQPGRRLRFLPRLATNDALDDGGLRPGSSYLVQLVGGSAANGTVLRSDQGDGLRQPASFQFTTAPGTTPAQLFRNPAPGGPRRTGFAVTPGDDLDQVPLGLFGAPPVEIRLAFDQALNPQSANLTLRDDPDPLLRGAAPGRIHLRYLDENGAPRWLPTTGHLEQNDVAGATVVLRPVGVLPNNATVQVVVAAALQDIAGEDNVADATYDPVFAEFHTAVAYEQQWNGIVEDFLASTIDPDAYFAETPAEVGVGFLRAGFDFGGKVSTSDYEPNANEVVLNTAYTSLVPTSGPPITVVGGEFHFRDVHIPNGVSVRGQGPNPMVWLCSGDFTVDGTLSVGGGRGELVNTLQSSGYAKAGGIGACSGGSGGDGTPAANQRDAFGGNGRGPRQVPNKGGQGGRIACAGCYTGTGYGGTGGGSGGGGGTMATQGDPHWRGPLPAGPMVPNVAPSANTRFQQLLGFGGSGCSGGSGTRAQFLTGGAPGALVFTDTRADNDFWGSAIDIHRNLRIQGELIVPIGGGGGGGGGDSIPAQTIDCSTTATTNTDYSGGGGGGGGGVLVVKALGTITVGATGRIDANGGDGGGGEQSGSCGQGGGGGGGAGGMVILMSASQIVLHAHGTQSRYRYAEKDYTFVVSADGGVCRTGNFASIGYLRKYPDSGSEMIAGTTYDSQPLGGLGGMGIVQLMAPPGDPGVDPDGTNTLLDDHIVMVRAGQVLAGADKQAMLAWRGFPDAAGTYRDDHGAVIAIGNDEGDIRPSPTLLPVPFGARSRARSKWIDTGASQRRELTAIAGPRGLLTTGGASAGPQFEFAGLQPSGFIAYAAANNTLAVEPPTVVADQVVASASAAASWLGQPAYAIDLAAAAFAEPDRYVAYEAELRDGNGDVLGAFRILHHSDRTLLLAPDQAPLPNGIARLRVRARFFGVVTNGGDGLGPIRSGSSPPSPIANVRIGFAFHSDPNDPAGSRYPADPQQFCHDLTETGLQEWVAEHGHPRYVMWDVLFDMAWQMQGNVGLSPNTPRPELHFLRLPFRF